MDKVKSALKSGKLQNKQSVVRIVEPSSARSSGSGDSEVVSEKPSTLIRFQNAKDKIISLKKKKKPERSTVVFLQGSSRRKNLAYYDKQIYELLKQRKQAQV